jgi:AcrR family transcriptional regulator
LTRDHPGFRQPSVIQVAINTAPRASVLPATRAVLSDPALPAWSIETVESAAGVTRMTVYNQFGSRAALIEAGIGVTRGAD